MSLFFRELCLVVTDSNSIGSFAKLSTRNSKRKIDSYPDGGAPARNEPSLREHLPIQIAITDQEMRKLSPMHFAAGLRYSNSSLTKNQISEGRPLNAVLMVATRMVAQQISSARRAP
jgi:hypothetical protein